MEIPVRRDPSVEKLFVFEEVYPARAAQEQAEKNKLDAFGRLARFNLLNRPKADTVALTTWELRYEPFWHVVARREVDYVHESTYAVPVTNPHALKVAVAGRDFEVTHVGGRARIDLPAREYCHRKIEVTLYQDGLKPQNGQKREIKPATLQRYVERYRAPEREALDRPDAVVNQVPLTAVTEIVRARLTTEAIDAHHITTDAVAFSKVHLYYRPVFAFEYVWASENRVGVIEIDGLTGEVIENGEWLREKIGQVMTRETLFDLGAEVAGAVVPGGGAAVKVIGRMTQPRPPGAGG
jgi:hypothetical protein